MSPPRRAPAGAPAKAPAPGREVRATARALAIAAFVLYALTGGGRVVGSDEVAMLELSRAMLQGSIAVPEGATLQGPDGRFYTKNAAAQAVLALPIVAVAEGVAAKSGLSPERRALAVRFAASFFNALVVALVVALFYVAARALGIGPGVALAASLLLGFTTPLWVYAKSFMAEPLQALGLLLALHGGTLAASRTQSAGRTAGAGAFLAISAKLSMLPLALACLLPALANRRARLGALLGVALALAGHALYDWARFGTVYETGYGAQAGLGAYSTPFLVGLYGLLLSSGKGVLWFAPMLWLAPVGWNALRRWGPRGTAWAVAIAWALALLLYSKFQHWAGDGSFGPRYLVPLLPLGALAVAFALDRLAIARRIAWLLGLLGLLVQIGGVSIYFGAQMREAGDYPYTLPLDHPRFMSDAHFNPRFSPILGHWRMLVRNAGEHLRGEIPSVRAGEGATDPRVGLSPEAQKALLHGLDFWWCYALYAGLPAVPVLGVAALLALFTVAAFLALGREAAAERAALRRAAEARAG